MRIWTSSWFEQLPPEIQKIGISRGTPRGYPAGYRKMMELAPGPWFNKVSQDEYFKLYMAGLAELNPSVVVQKIATLSDGRDAALLCYEPPHDPEKTCHRAYVSGWLQDTLGLEVYEYGMEEHGCGWAHPKLPRQYRRRGERAGAAIEPLDVDPYVGRTAIDRNQEIWRVEGRSAENPDQADILNLMTGELRSVSVVVLKTRFGASTTESGDEANS